MPIPQRTVIRGLACCAALAAAPGLHSMSAALPVPYTQPDPVSEVYGDPNRGPEPNPVQAEDPLPEYDEERVRATVNQGNPFEDYGHFRLKRSVVETPWAVEEGSGPTQVDSLLLQQMFERFDRPRDWKDGSLLRYTLLRPPSNAEMPKEGWPLVIVNPGVGGVGEQGGTPPENVSRSDSIIWTSPYHRSHYPAYVIAWHPQDRATAPPGSSNAGPSYPPMLEMLDDFLDSHPVDRNRIYVKGFSMGGATTWRFLFDRPDFYAAVIPYAGALSIDVEDLTSVRTVPIWMMVGNQDPWTGSAGNILTYQALLDAGVERIRFWEVQDLAHHSHGMRSFFVPEWLFSHSLHDPQRAVTPTVLKHPAGTEVTEGGSVTMQANFMGAPAPTVQWRKDGLDIPGETAYFLRISSVSLEDAGAYSVVATNDSGSVETGTAQLTVHPDTAAPTVVSVAAPSATVVSVLFDKAVEAGSGDFGAENPANYMIAPGIEVSSSTLREDGRTVVLDVESLDGNVPYVLTVAPVQDRAATPNRSLVARVPFTYVPGLAAHWKLDDGTGGSVLDSAGRGAHGSLADGPQWTAHGRIDGALRFDGGESRAVLPATGLDTGRGTLSLWARRDASGNDRRQSILYKEDSGAPDSRLMVTLTQASGFLTFALGDQSSISAGTSLATGGPWRHIALVWKDSGYRGYIDGQEVAEGDYGLFEDPGGDLFLGNRPALDQGFAGSVDDVRLYDLALEAGEIASLYYAGIIPAAPEITALALEPADGGTMAVTFFAEEGIEYVLEYSADLSDPVGWEPVPGEMLTGAGENATLTAEALPTDSKARFFRVVARPNGGE
ncbi:MAG: immunoglobulin domain-containing protein [Opitutales bacterium]|nr:immunoglobulin domain-containing protein [Opitutales bacterium]